MRQLSEQEEWMIDRFGILGERFGHILERAVKMGASSKEIKDVMISFACTIITVTSEDYGFNSSEMADIVAERVYNLTEGGDI